MEFEDRFGYDELLGVLKEAYEQASNGKGRERHAHSGQKFVDQKIITGQRKYGMGFALGQADKKMEEAFHMEDWTAAKRDLLGAIVYISAAIIYGNEVYAKAEKESDIVEPDEEWLVKPPVEDIVPLVKYSDKD